MTHLLVNSLRKSLLSSILCCQIQRFSFGPKNRLLKSIVGDSCSLDHELRTHVEIMKAFLRYFGLIYFHYFRVGVVSKTYSLGSDDYHSCPGDTPISYLT